MIPRVLRPYFRTWRHRGKVNKCVLFLVIIMVAFEFLDLFVFVNPVFHWNSQEEDGNKFYLVSTSTCMIPDLEHDEDILDYIYPVESPRCLFNQEPSPTASYLNFLYIPDRTLKYYGLKNVNQLSCCYRSFNRPHSNHPDPDNTIILEKGCHRFNNVTEVKHEFIHVTCNIKAGRKKRLLQDMHAFVPSKPTSWSDYKSTPSRDLSILILGIHSMSRLNLERQMPRTNSLLRSMSAVQMLGYNKVGENTFENLLPFLTGLSVPELKVFCWPNESSPFDNCPFIWNKFSNAGYYTAFADDASDTSMFNRGRKGFMEQPTDYYLRPYFLYGDKIFASPSGECYGPQLKIARLLEYIQKFVEKHKKYFGVFWETSLTHNALNYPEILDEIMYKFIVSLRPKLQNTVLILMTDHGTRIGEFAETYQGYLENRLPLLTFAFPRWFQDECNMAMKILKTNSRRLTTHFDLHETLLDMINVTLLGNDYLNFRMKEVTNIRQRGISLFRQIPEERTCEEAGISPHWCTCNPVQKMTSKHYIVVNYLSRQIVQFINNQIQNFTDCYPLRLLALKDVRMHTAPNTNYAISYYLIVHTFPGNAVFGGTFQKLNAGGFKLQEGDVERLDSYGNQSFCIKDQSSYYHPFCYCKQY